MKNLIKALNIFSKYGNNEYPTGCAHDILLIHHYDKEDISKKDLKELDKLGFFWSTEYECFGSFRYGSA